MKARFFVFLFFLTPLFPCFLAAQEQDETESAGIVYVIREIEFDVDGSTRPWALMSNGEFEEGERIAGIHNFNRYIALKQQLLINLRLLDEVAIDYSFGEPEEDGALPVKLVVHVKDSWNFIVIPVPQYDSNEGLSITLKARDYNFFGTMSALRADLGYQYDENGNSSFNFLFDSDIPFMASGFQWNLNFDHTFDYTFEEPLYYQNVTGLSVKLPAGFTNVTLGFNQYLTFNEEISDENKENYSLAGDYYSPYGSTRLYASWNIPLGIEVGDFGGVSYTPEISGRINYPYSKMDEPRRPVTTLSHSLAFGRIDWIENYRKGISVSIGNSLNWFFDRSDAPLSVNLALSSAVYWPFSKYFGVSSRLMYRHWWHWSDNKNDWLPYYNAGDVVRGVIDDNIRANYMLSFNIDFPVRVLLFRPSEWFNQPKLHFFDFEMQLSPFADFALFNGPYNELKNPDNPFAETTSFALDDIITAAGLEILVFPAFFRSLKIRASIGYDLNEIRMDGLDLRWGFFPDWDEIYIGVDLYY